LQALVLWVPLLVAKIDPGAIGNTVLAAGGGILGLVTAILGYRGTKMARSPAADASSLRTQRFSPRRRWGFSSCSRAGSRACSM
jgi:hypothetical protein